LRTLVRLNPQISLLLILAAIKPIQIVMRHALIALLGLIEFAYQVGESVIVLEQDLKILGIWLLQQLLYLD
jgi:hypothetical protein